MLPSARADLVGYWKFNEATGTATTDSSGRGNAATLLNGATWTPAPVGTGVDFDGVNDFVSAGSSPVMNLAGDHSVAGWVRVNGAGGDCALIHPYGHRTAGGFLGAAQVSLLQHGGEF